MLKKETVKQYQPKDKKWESEDRVISTSAPLYRSSISLFLTRLGLSKSAKEHYPLVNSNIYPAASPTERMLAAIIDPLIFWTALLTLILLTAVIFQIELKVTLVTLAGLKSNPSYNELYLLLNILTSLPIILIWSKFKTSPGRILMGIRIVDTSSGQLLTPPQKVKRGLATLLSAIPFFAGFLWILLDKNQKGWHDYLSKSSVVKFTPKIHKH